MALLLAGALFVLFQSALSVSGNFTVLSHTMTFGGLGGCTILVYKCCFKKSVHWMEVVSMLCALCGCLVISNDPHSSKTDGIAANILLGDCIGLLASLLIPFYYMLLEALAAGSFNKRAAPDPSTSG